MITQKEKLSIQQQIEHMKSKGIRFEIVSEEAAFEYLEKNNYYFKLKSYAKLFEKYKSGDKKGQYVNLDFAYLKELATLDMHLRHFIIRTTLDIEHAVKVHLLNDFNNSGCDGYDIVDKYFQFYENAHNKILGKKDTAYCSDLIDKLENTGYALWNIVELLSFGDFINLYDLFYEEYPEALKGIKYTYPLRTVKSLRNAAAHNNCILNQLEKEADGKNRPNSKVKAFISENKQIGKTLRQNCMKRQAVRDFTTLLYVIDNVIDSDGVRDSIIKELEWLFIERMPKHADYFQKNNTLLAVYDFMRKVIDYQF